MKNVCQNISLSSNSFVDVLPAHEKKSRKMLILFYRTASEMYRLPIQAGGFLALG